MRLPVTLALVLGLGGPVLLIGCDGKSNEETPAATSQAAIEIPAIEVPELPAFTLTALNEQSVEVGCAKCSYEMPGVESCKAAVVVSGHPVLLGGAPGVEHAHSFCGGTKQAVVTAEVYEGQLIATKMTVE